MHFDPYHGRSTMKHKKTSQNSELETVDRRVNRRRFLSGMAIGAGLAPLAALSTSLRAGQGSSSSNALCVGPSVLTAGDLTYLGAINLPSDTAGARFGWSRAAMTGRRVGSSVRLFITGSIGGPGDNNGVLDAVYKVQLNGLQKATFIRNWGDITQGRKLVIDGANGTELRGMVYSNGYLYWAYGDAYFSGAAPNPSIGASVLNDTTGAIQAYGPWRTDEHSQKTRGYMTLIPADAAAGGGRTIGVGAPTTSGNAFSPRGAMLEALDAFNPATLPADNRSNTSSVSIRGKRVVYSDVNQPQQRDANYHICGYNVDNDPSSGGWIAPGDPTWNNRGPRGDLSLDRLDGVAWVRTPNVEGLLFVGQMTGVVPGATTYAGDSQPHVWYGPANNTCPHGQPTRTEGTGPKSGSMVPVAIVFDPARLAQSAAPVPSATIPLKAPGLVTNATNDPVFGGAWFDDTSKILYISVPNAGFDGEPRPIILAYQVR